MSTVRVPKGVRYDPRILHKVPLSAPRWRKERTVLRVARSKLGTPYRWGQNLDRGQKGFDCSNYTSYVYKHALGYRMSTSAWIQYRKVGNSVPRRAMRPGDLLIFDYGSHVGIYVGNQRMIQAGGGLRKVGYLKIGPSSDWFHRLTSVRRMF